MNVEIQLSPTVKEPYAVIYTHAITEEIRKITTLLEAEQIGLFPVKKDEAFFLLHPDEIYAIRVEEGQTLIYTKEDAFVSSKRLYELEGELDAHFIRISKSTLVNLREIYRFEPSFNGAMLVTMKNQFKDYISRKYLPVFKKRLGL